MIISKCPLRISLIGGSTDLQGFIDKFGKGSVISFPSNLYTYITINKNITDSNYKINYSTSEKTLNPKTIKNDIAREVIQYFNLPPIIMSFNSDIPSSGSGLASSSSYLIACIAAACEFTNTNLSQAEICKLALKLERNFNPLTGYQDPYGCGIGGLKKYNFYKNQITQELLSSSVINDYNLYLIPTDIKRSSTKILNTINYDKSYHLLKLVNDLKQNLNDEIQFFDIFNKGWESKKQSSSLIVNKEILLKEEMIKKAWNIKGIKLCGAGGGGYFLVFTKDVLRYYKQIEIDNKGVVAWKI
tara:strand:- start:7563 stop:8465 length:903 start_codon:yes stop_codon:yes gene_type:complete